MTGAADLMRELKAKEGEVDAGKKREAALRLIIAKAARQGFALNDQIEANEELRGDDIMEEDRELVGKLTDALVRLKQEKASIQVSCSPFSVKRWKGVGLTCRTILLLRYG